MYFTSHLTLHTSHFKKMSIELNKKTGINLSKGSRISLEKDGHKLEEVCIGLNWGSIKKPAFFTV